MSIQITIQSQITTHACISCLNVLEKLNAFCRVFYVKNRLKEVIFIAHSFQWLMLYTAEHENWHISNNPNSLLNLSIW